MKPDQLASPRGEQRVGDGMFNVWDGQNRLIQCAFNGTTTNHTYGSDGLRRRTTQGATSIDYVVDGQGAVRTLLNGVVDRTYLHGARGPEYERIGSSAPVWYLYDGLGSVLGTVDAAGNLVSTRKYDVYGAVRGSTGPSGTKHKFVGQLGHPSEEETGLVYMRARYYDPVTGRFQGEDPHRQGINWFNYTPSNPANYVDLTGREFTLSGTLQSMALGGLSSAFMTAINEWLWTGTITAQNVVTWLIIGAMLGAGLANAGAYGKTLGSFIDGASMKEVWNDDGVGFGLLRSGQRNRIRNRGTDVP